MSARDEIAEILEQWLQLTRAEGAAIQSASWPAVDRIQARKAILQKSLAEAARKSTSEEAAGRPTTPALAPFRAKAAQINSLLTRNAEALAAQVRRARARQKLLDETKRNLSRIQRSYLRPHLPTAWHSYS